MKETIKNIVVKSNLFWELQYQWQKNSLLNATECIEKANVIVDKLVNDIDMAYKMGGNNAEREV